MESTVARWTLFFMLILGSLGAAESIRLTKPETIVRVAVLKDAAQFKILVRGRYQVSDAETGLTLGQGRRLKSSVVSLTASGIQIGDNVYPVKRVRVRGQKDISLKTDRERRRYREALDIIRTNSNRLLVINRLSLEAYVKGVLYHEVSHRWPLEAIKAQAVATRTYVLYQMSQSKKREYDVTSDIYSQVYGGRSAERHRTRLAADRTRGQVMTYEGKILPAYFHSNCGGHRESAGELWRHDFIPLRAAPCEFCEGMPNYRWNKNFHSQEVQEKLNHHGIRVGAIKEINVIERTEGGRAKTLEFVSREGEALNVPAAKFRKALGANVLKSNYYDILMKGYYFDVLGRGWGHGVGMCQWGAYQMSRQRYPYEEILKYYYPETELVTISQL